LRILSYNIHKGFSFKQTYVLDQIKNAISELQADLVFLQEVLGEHRGHRKKQKNWPITSQLDYLAESLWPHHVYGKNAVYSQGHHGNAMMSAHPFRSFENIDISTNRFERRGLLHGVVDWPGCESGLHVICVHLDLLERARKNQVDWICQRIKKAVPISGPLIIAGDFNDWRQSLSPILEKELGVQEVFKTQTGQHALSFPSFWPVLRLDRIYIRGLRLHEARCLSGDPWRKLSDHNALYSELTIL
jgi:endonuclease/exonuclease/phosphatase family metal-dependent hydrolase